MTADSMIDYETLAQDAMRNVVRTVLTDAAAKGLPGDHHFYISFDTLAPGVILSKRLREKYAEEMTIVLQHRFWDLIINEHRFEVKLTFDGIPERLVVPFNSIRVFFDPSVRYGLQFETVASAQAAQEAADAAMDDVFDDPFAEREFSNEQSSPVPIGTVPLRRGRPGPDAGDKSGLMDADDADDSNDVTSDQPQPKFRPKRLTRAKDHDAQEHKLSETDIDVAEPADADSGNEEAGAEIVSLDAFRKK